MRKNIFVNAKNIRVYAKKAISHMAVSRLDEDERGIPINDTPSGQQQMVIINESGLYSLTLTSTKPAAKRLTTWRG